MYQEWNWSKNSFLSIVFIRVTFDGNLFHSAEGLFKKFFADLLHSYCLGQDRYIQAFARPEIFYYSAITITFFALNCFRNSFLMHKIKPFLKQRATLL